MLHLNTLNSAVVDSKADPTSNTYQNASSTINHIGDLLTRTTNMASVPGIAIGSMAEGFTLQQLFDTAITNEAHSSAGAAINTNENELTANSAPAIGSNVTATGGQSAIGSVNAIVGALAGIGPSPARGTVIRAFQPTGSTARASVINQNNAISATARHGNAGVGVPRAQTQQSATTRLNAITLSTPAARAIAGFDQKMAGNGDIASETSNTAVAESITGSPAAVQTFLQESSVSLNSLIANGSLAVSSAASGLRGGQEAHSLSRLSESQSNMSLAYTSDAGLGSGSARVDGVSQDFGVNINTVSGGGDLVFGDASSPFQQTQGGGSVVGGGVSIHGINVGSNLGNLQEAVTANGAAAISGGNLIGQLTSVELNSIAANGIIFGSVMQHLSNSNDGTTYSNGVEGSALKNVAIAQTMTGAATVYNLAQAQIDSVNSLIAQKWGGRVDPDADVDGSATVGRIKCPNWNFE